MIFKYLLYTLVLELPVVVFAYKKQWRNVLPVATLINCFTWPLMMLIYYNTSLPFIITEGLVVITEMLLFKIFFRGGWLKAFAVSLAANAISFFLGALLAGVHVWDQLL